MVNMVSSAICVFVCYRFVRFYRLGFVFVIFVVVAA